jgi:hypothetical protein
MNAQPEVRADELESEPDAQERDTLHLFVIAIVAIFVIWVLFGLFHSARNTGKLEDKAHFGDIYGSLNALFSGIAFAALFYTIILQRQELGHQRKELALHRHELALTRLEQQRSAQAQEQLEASSRQQTYLFHRTAVLNSLNHLITSYDQELDRYFSDIQRMETALAEAREKRHLSKIHGLEEDIKSWDRQRAELFKKRKHCTDSIERILREIDSSSSFTSASA